MVDVTWAKLKDYNNGAIASYPDADNATVTLNTEQLSLSGHFDDGNGNVKNMNVTINISDTAGLDTTLINAMKSKIDAS